MSEAEHHDASLSTEDMMNTPRTRPMSESDRTRRRLTLGSAVALAVMPFSPGGAWAQAVEGVEDAPAGPSKEDWLDTYFGKKAFGEPMAVSRFLDRTYYLIRPLWWQATGPSEMLGKITVPTGFVTDFASIPRVFWSVLPPDDDYVTAAVVHDWLYWNQGTTRERADQALRDSMSELGVAAAKSWTVYQGVNLFGATAWNDNAALKSSGERRVLKSFPADLAVRWKDWKTKSDVFM